MHCFDIQLLHCHCLQRFKVQSVTRIEILSVAGMYFILNVACMLKDLFINQHIHYNTEQQCINSLILRKHMKPHHQQLA
jgi:hypothetical protein